MFDNRWATRFAIASGSCAMRATSRSCRIGASELLPIVDQHLRKAQRSANLNDEAKERHALGTSVQPISMVSSDGYAEDLDLLVEVARDCMETLLNVRPEEASAQLSTWASSDVVLLRRLAIHGWTIRQDVNAKAKASWLARLELILGYDYISDVTPLLLAVISSNDEDALQIVLEDMLGHASDDEYTLRRRSKRSPPASSRLENALIIDHPAQQ